MLLLQDRYRWRVLALRRSGDLEPIFPVSSRLPWS